MSLQTPSDVKVKKEAPVEVDSSPPSSPDSFSENSDSTIEPLVKAKVWEGGCISDQRTGWDLKWFGKGEAHDTCHHDFYSITFRGSKSSSFPQRCFLFTFTSVFKLCVLLNPTLFISQDTPPRSSAPTPTIVRPGSLPLHLGFDALQPTMPSPTSVITQAPPSNRTLGWVKFWQHPSTDFSWTLQPWLTSCISPWGALKLSKVWKNIFSSLKGYFCICWLQHYTEHMVMLMGEPSYSSCFVVAQIYIH